MGNLRSVAKAFEAAGASVTVSADPRVLAESDGLCVPGQGIFGRCIVNLQASGTDSFVGDWIGEGRPYFGICLGMQILFDHGEESDAGGLGIVPGLVRRIEGDVTLPHIGWNTVEPADCAPPSRSEPRRGSEGEYYYFDHSYVAVPADDGVVAGWCDHGERFAASISAGPITATQFHPEKSGEAGIELLKDWMTE